MNEFSRATREGALLVARPERGTLVVTGPDALSWLNGLVTCDTLALAPGRGAWGLSLTKQGKVQSDLWLVSAPARTFLATAEGAAESLAPVLERMLVMEDAELAVATAQHGWLALHGPRAAELATRCAGSHGAAAGPIDWTGLGGAAVVAPRERLPELQAALLAAGAVLGDDAAWVALRAERGVPEFGVDFDGADNPHEASLDRRAVSWTKGCYLGQEVVCMQDMRGRVKRRVVALVLDGDSVPARGARVTALPEGDAGEITTAAWSHALGRPVALARVTSAFAEPGTALLVAGSAATVAAPYA